MKSAENVMDKFLSEFIEEFKPTIMSDYEFNACYYKPMSNGVYDYSLDDGYGLILVLYNENSFGGKPYKPVIAMCIGYMVVLLIDFQYVNEKLMMYFHGIANLKNWEVKPATIEAIYEIEQMIFDAFSDFFLIRCL